MCTNTGKIGSQVKLYRPLVAWHTVWKIKVGGFLPYASGTSAGHNTRQTRRVCISKTNFWEFKWIIIVKKRDILTDYDAVQWCTEGRCSLCISGCAFVKVRAFLIDFLFTAHYVGKYINIVKLMTRSESDIRNKHITLDNKCIIYAINCILTDIASKVSLSLRLCITWLCLKHDYVWYTRNLQLPRHIVQRQTHCDALHWIAANALGH